MFWRKKPEPVKQRELPKFQVDTDMRVIVRLPDSRYGHEYMRSQYFTPNEAEAFARQLLTAAVKVREGTGKNND